MLHSTTKSWSTFDKIISEEIKKVNTKNVLEIGGGANPQLVANLVTNNNIEYTVLDISDEELKKSESTYYETICHNLSTSPLERKYDLIFSKMVLEHLIHPYPFHENVKKMMHPETVIVHFFATKYGLPSLLNLVMPSFISDFIVYKLQKRDPHKDGKFKAYYRRSFGPTRKSIKYFEDIGYKILRYDGFLGHGYLSRYKLMGKFEEWFSKIILKLNSPLFCSNAIVILKKLEP